VEGQARSRGQLVTELEATLSQMEEGLKITEAAVAGEWLLPCIPLILFSHLWPLTLALFMFRARNEDWSPEDQTVEVGRCSSRHRVRAGQCQGTDGMKRAGVSRFFGEEQGP
jgi:hypothetical protein